MPSTSYDCFSCLRSFFIHPLGRRSLAILIPATVSIFALCQGCASRQSPISFAEKLRTGDYLREDYIEALCSTFSPLRATRPDDYPQLIQVACDQIGIAFMPVHNFHEGDNLYVAAKDGVLKERDDDVPRELGRLTIHGIEAFSLSTGIRTYRFRFVADAERWVTNAVIAGSYKDASGHDYSLGRDGMAHFLRQKPFSYTLGLDHVLTGHDYIYSRNPERSWAVFISKKGIALHDGSGDADEIVSEAPRWTLTRLSSASCKQP